MACFKHGTIISLAPRESMSLPDVRGTTLRITRGTLWITQENDTQDIVLRAGDEWVVERDGLTILEAQADATFSVQGRPLETFVLPRLVERLTPSVAWRYVREAAAAFFATPTRSPAPYV